MKPVKLPDGSVLYNGVVYTEKGWEIKLKEINK